MPAVPQKVLDLVEIFDRNSAEYLAADFKEAMLRQQFINPLFKCLGWDMDNEQGYAEAYKDVTLFDDEVKYRINVFDWYAAFPEIRRAGAIRRRA